MLLSTAADIRRVAILAGAYPKDLVDTATGEVPMAREDIESALRNSATVHSRGWIRTLLGMMAGFAGVNAILASTSTSNESCQTGRR